MDLGHRDVLTTALVVLPLVFASGARADVPATSPTTVVAPGAEVVAHAVIGPVLTTDGASAKGDKDIPWRKVSSSDLFVAKAREVELALRDAAQDLGLAVDYGIPLASDGIRDADLVKSAAAGHWVISPRIEQVGSDGFVLRMVAVPPKSPAMLVRVERTDGAHLATRAAVMLRDFVQMKIGAGQSAITPEENGPPPEEEEKRRSKGRPVLAVSSTLFGLYTAYSIHRASGRDDPRLLYPLLALGSGIGLGASLLVADEWNVTPGDAWTIAAGSWWGVVAGSSWATGRNAPNDDRYAWGLAGGLVGTTAAAAWTAVHRFDDGGATLVHSGAALGTFVGGLTDLLIRGSVKDTAATGAGLGAGTGFLAGGVLAMFVQTSAQRVLLVDLGAGLGALAGASVASPLVFKDETAARTRLFVASVLGGTVLGGSLAWLATRDSAPKPTKTAIRVLPVIGPLGTPDVPSYGAGVFGLF